MADRREANRLEIASRDARVSLQAHTEATDEGRIMS